MFDATKNNRDRSGNRALLRLRLRLPSQRSYVNFEPGQPIKIYQVQLRKRSRGWKLWCWTLGRQLAVWSPDLIRISPLLAKRWGGVLLIFGSFQFVRGRQHIRSCQTLWFSRPLPFTRNYQSLDENMGNMITTQNSPTMLSYEETLTN